MQQLDVCTVCHFVWFDPTEFEAMPGIPPVRAVEATLPPSARERLALMEVASLGEKLRGGDWGADIPEEGWKWIPAALGLPFEHDPPHAAVEDPWATWIFATLIGLVSILAFFNLDSIIRHFGLIPAEFARYGGLTFFTSVFLHVGLFHLISNLYFLLVFGDDVEAWLGKARFVVLLTLSAFMGGSVHIAAGPTPDVPCVGASGAISGVITCYALRFPKARIGVLLRVFLIFQPIRAPAYALFLFWIGLQFVGTWQQFSGLSNVSALAHLGGVAAGFLCWLVWRARV